MFFDRFIRGLLAGFIAGIAMDIIDLVGYWLARLVRRIPLSGASVLVSAEKRANFTAPQGLGVAVGTIP